MNLLPYIPAEKVREFDIVLVSGTSTISTLIKEEHDPKPDLVPQSRLKWFTKSQFNHAAIAIQTKIGLMWEEALAEGVSLSDITKYCSAGSMKFHKYDGALLMRYAGVLTSNRDRRVYPLLAGQRKAMRKRAEQLLGSKYDFLALFVGFPLMIWLKLRGLFVKTPQRWVCSSTVAEIYHAARIILVEDRNVKAVTPEDIYQSQLLEIVE